MAERIVVKVDLDETEFKQRLGMASDKAEKDLKKVGDRVDRSLNVTLEKTTGLVEGLNAAVLGVGAALLKAPPLGKGLFGTIAKLGFSSASLLAVSEALKQIENDTAASLAELARFAALLSGGLAAGLTFAVFKVAELSQSLGTSLLNSLIKIRDKSLELISSQNILNKIIDNYNVVTGFSIGTTGEWQKAIDNLSQSLNISQKELNKSAQEIITVGSQIGLTRKQMLGLLKVSADYAKINKKEVFPVTLALVKGLTGNSQAVQELGLKLNQATIRSFAYSKGLNKNFESLTDNELVQLRYQKLLKQYSTVAGIAEVAASQLADQQNALEVQLERISKSFGEGVNVVENYNLASSALSKILKIVDDDMLKVSGIVSTLGARFFQIIGFAAEWALKLFAVTKALKLVNIIVNSNISATALYTKEIKFLNTNVGTLVSNLTRGKVGLKEFSSFTQIAKSKLTDFSRLFLNFSKSGRFNLFASLGQTIKTLAGSLRLLTVALVPLLVPFAKIAIVAGVLIGTYKLLSNAVQEVQNRTKAFTEIYSILVSELSSSTSIFKPVLDFFVKLKESVIDLAVKGFGVLVFALTKVIKLASDLAQKDPFGVFSEKSKTRLAELSTRLSGFGNNLKQVAFDITQLPDQADRAVAGVANKTVVNIEQLANKLNQLRDQFKFFGLTDVEIIRQKEAESLEVLRMSLENGLVLEKEYGRLRSQIREDALNRIKGIEAKANEERLKEQKQNSDKLNAIVNQSFANAISQGIQKIITNINKGKAVFQDLFSVVLNIFGDMSIQIGQALLLIGTGIEALKSLQGAAAIAAGAGLIALGAIIKGIAGRSSSGGESASSGGVAAIGAEPASGQVSTPLAEPEEVEERQVGTSVNIVVEGSLVRQEELGEFISETLNASFGKQGITLTDARIA